MQEGISSLKNDFMKEHSNEKEKTQRRFRISQSLFIGTYACKQINTQTGTHT